MINNDLNNPFEVSSQGNKNHFIDFLNLIKNNILTLIIIAALGLAISITYAMISPDIYTSECVVKVSMPQGSILESPLTPQTTLGLGTDQFMMNEIETLNNSTLIYEQAAKAVVDSFTSIGKEGDWNTIIEPETKNLDKQVLLPVNKIKGILAGSVKVSQIENLTFLEISASSLSPFEAALFANCFAKAYRDFNLYENRRQVTMTREILANQKDSMQMKLREAEDKIKDYQLAGGIIELDKTAAALVDKMSRFETDRNSAKIEMSVARQRLNQYKRELEKKDPTVLTNLESKSAEPYIRLMQDQIARFEVQRDLALNQGTDGSSAQIKEYDKKINELKEKLKKSQQEYLSSTLTSSPEEVKQLSEKIFEEEVKYQALSSSYGELNNVIGSYENKFNQLPSRTIGFARLERERATYEQLYILLEQKYQESLINEQSIPGNVIIMGKAGVPSTPSKPNRRMIIMMGLFLGFGIGFGFIYVRSYFDKTIKSPEDIEAKNINVLAWIPKISNDDLVGVKNPELIVAQKPESIPSEAFRTVRTRLQFSHVTKGAKTFLVTSSAPGEGKTTISINLAASFAQASKRSVIVDCDLRKPRLYALFNENDSNGFLDHIFNEVPYENIIKKTEIRNLDYITAGSIPSNPSEILGSSAMHTFLSRLKNDYDIVIIDSPPIMAVSDSEILARFVDVCLLVVSANTTEIEWLNESVDLLRQEHVNLAGVLLNNFNYKSGYHSYYKYYDHYSENYKSYAKKNLFRKSI